MTCGLRSTYIRAMYSGPVTFVIRPPCATSSSPDRPIRFMSSIMVSTNAEKVDVSFSKSVCGRLSLTSQLRGRVMSCGRPPWESTRWAMMNNAESLSARSHNTIRSKGTDRLRRTSLGRNIRRDVHGFISPALRTADMMNQRSVDRTLLRLQTRRIPARRTFDWACATRLAATASRCTSA